MKLDWPLILGVVGVILGLISASRQLRDMAGWAAKTGKKQIKEADEVWSEIAQKRSRKTETLIAFGFRQIAMMILLVYLATASSAQDALYFQSAALLLLGAVSAHTLVILTQIIRADR